MLEIKPNQIYRLRFPGIAARVVERPPGYESAEIPILMESLFLKRQWYVDDNGKPFTRSSPEIIGIWQWSRMKTALVAFGVITLYFALALWAEYSYVDMTPKGKDVSQIIGPFFKWNGVFAVRVWLSTSDRQVFIYENSASLGLALRHYNDPDRPFQDGGKRWQYVEFLTQDGSDPNENGRHYWAVKP
jgi:hypothetical protein